MKIRITKEPNKITIELDNVEDACAITEHAVHSATVSTINKYLYDVKEVEKKELGKKNE